MKKINLLLLVLILGQLSAFSQTVPNGDFESWANDTTPVSWGTLTSCACFLGVPSGVFRDTSDPAHGNSCVRMVTDSFGGGVTVPGFVGSGQTYTDTTGGLYFSGVPFSYRPDTLYFYAKYLANQPDTAYVYITLMKAATPLLNMEFSISPGASSWSLYSLPLTMGYQSGDTPDTLLLVFATSNTSNPNPPYGSTLYVDDVSFNAPLTVPTVSLDSNRTVCIGSSITFSPAINGGTPPFSYQWSSNGSALSCTNCENPSTIITTTSTYQVTITDYDNQTVTASVTYIVDSSNNAIQLSISNSNITCASPDITVVNVVNGLPPYTFYWDDTTAQTGGSIASHPYNEAGVYPIAVSDQAGCVSSLLDTVLNAGILLSVTSQTTPVCRNDATGAITVSASGAQTPYSFLWSNGATTDSITNVVGQVYDVTVTDANSCSAVYSFTLLPEDRWQLFTYLNVTNSNCSNNGSISAEPEGGIPPYSYFWSDSLTTYSITGLGGGNYSLVVTDSLGCTASAQQQVYQNCQGTITGFVFNDTNNNCIMDSGETPVANEIVVAVSFDNQYYYGFTDNTGFYNISVSEVGAYTLQVLSYFNECGTGNFCGSGQVTFNTLTDTSANNNFAFTSSSGFDIGLHPGWLPADPGFQKEYWIFYYNLSPTNFNGIATITFQYDSNLIYQYSNAPLPTHNPFAHTLIWTVDSIPGSLWDWYGMLQSFFMVPSSLDPGYLLQSDFTILPMEGDCDTTDNHLHFSEICTGSHDPNEKDVIPAGKISDADSVLTYTIHFQNTGTDSTYFISIVDTLSPSLNPASVRTIASNPGNYQFTISGSGILTWTFKPFRLVDSITNPQGSKGFVTFTVKTGAGRAAGNVISNTASVYFDYNQPVRTNTVTDTQTVAAGVTKINTKDDGMLVVHPNPTSDVLYLTVSNLEPQVIKVYDVNGQKVIEEKFSNQLSVASLPSGIYLIEVNGIDADVRTKFVKL